MASLQARHQRDCAIVRERKAENEQHGKNGANQWTPYAAVEGCTCKPMYYTDTGGDHGKGDRVAVGHNRKDAARALRKLQDAVEDGTYVPIVNKLFSEWADEWLASLRGPKENTRRSYVSTLGYAKRAFGAKQVRKIGVADINKFLALMDKISASTQAKHLRVLNSCLSSAIEHGYASKVPKLRKAERPRPEKREAAYFENDELAPLFAQLPEGVWKMLCTIALKTGMRRGELLALRWGDVDLTAAVIRVRRTWTAGRETLPKSHERRDVDLTPELVDLLGAWWGTEDKPADDELVFADPLDGYLHAEALLRSILYPAMKRAGVPRVGPTGEQRTFHSFRHTYGRIALEAGRPLTWLSKAMGHSSTAVTDRVYGHWSAVARQAEAAKMEGAFPV